MSAATRFIHDRDVGKQALAVLEAELPTLWTDDDECDEVFLLKQMRFGSMVGYKYSGKPGNTGIMDFVPGIFVRVGEVRNESEIYGGIGGKEGVTPPLNIVYLFTDAQMRDETDTTQHISVDETKAQRIATIGEALFQDRILGETDPPTALTVGDDDASARIVLCHYIGHTYTPEENILHPDVYAIMIQLEVWTLTQ